MLIIKTNQQQKQEIQLKNHDIERLSTYNDAIETVFAESIKNSGILIEGKIIAKDTANVATLLSEIANQETGNILVFRYSNRMCRECVKHTISIFSNNKDSFDEKKILFLADDTNHRILKIDISEYGLHDCRVLNCPNLGIPAEEAMFPYIMAVDSSLRVLSVYFPNKGTRGTDYDYKHVKYMYDKLIKEN